MILQIYISKDTELTGDIGRFYIDTLDIEFINEVNKYKCPIRMGLFLDNEIKTNPNVREIITDKEIKESHTDLFIDLIKETDEIIQEHTYAIFDFNKYINDTKSFLDRYGNPLEEIEECDLSMGTDAQYEMNIDNLLYK